MEIYRTFVGVPLKVGDSFLQDRKVLMEKLREDRISWVDPERFHVTLRFIGDTESELAKEIGEALDAGLPLPSSTNLGFSGPGIFGPRKKPRVIWVGFENGELFGDLHWGVNRVLEKSGFPGPDQPFRPHLTLGRIRSIPDPRRLHAVVGEMERSFRGEVIADRLVYYRSILGNGGPVYQPLKTMIFPD